MKDKTAQSRPFYKRSIYLDLKGSPYETSLAKDLKVLGAIMVPMFNKDVSCVVSNRVPLKSTNSVEPNSKAASKTNYWTPPTPVTMIHSPQGEFSVKSPAISNSPASNGNLLPMSRGMALIQKATQKKSGTTDILDVCSRYGVKVYNVDKMLAKVKQLKNLFPSKYVLEKKIEKQKVISATERKLKAPFIKIEDSNGFYKPQYKEFSSWKDVITPELSKKICELKKNFKGPGKLDTFARPALKEINRDLNKPTILHNSIFSTNLNSSKTISLPKYSSFPKPSDSTSVYAFTAKKNPDIPSNVSKKKKKTKRKNKRRLYCEICSKYLTDLDEHLESEEHKKFMSDPINYLSVQNIISSLKVSKREMPLLDCYEATSILLSGEYDMPELPMVNDDNEFPGYFQTYCSNIADEENSMLNPLDCDTEVYTYIDPDHVSPSVITPETKRLNCLQDSFEEKEDKYLENLEHCCKNIVKLLEIPNEVPQDIFEENDMIFCQTSNENIDPSFPMESINTPNEMLLKMNRQVLDFAESPKIECDEGISIGSKENMDLVSLYENALKDTEGIIHANPKFEYDRFCNGNGVCIKCGDDIPNSNFFVKKEDVENCNKDDLNIVNTFEITNSYYPENFDGDINSTFNLVLCDEDEKITIDSDCNNFGGINEVENEDQVPCKDLSKVGNENIFPFKDISKTEQNCLVPCEDVSKTENSVANSIKCEKDENADESINGTKNASSIFFESEFAIQNKEAESKRVDTFENTSGKIINSENGIEFKEFINNDNIEIYSAQSLTRIEDFSKEIKHDMNETDIIKESKLKKALENQSQSISSKLTNINSNEPSNYSKLVDETKELHEIGHSIPVCGNNVSDDSSINTYRPLDLRISLSPVSKNETSIHDNKAESLCEKNISPPEFFQPDSIGTVHNDTSNFSGIGLRKLSNSKCGFLFPKESSDEAFSGNENESNSENENEWHALHSQVSNLYEKLDFSEEL